MANEKELHIAIDRIEERLRDLELNNQRHSTFLETEVGNLVKLMSEIRDIIKRHDELFFGNGKPGLLTRLDRLEQKEESRKWALRVALTSLIGLVIKILWDHVLFQKH